MPKTVDLEKLALQYLPTVADAFAYEPGTDKLMFSATANTDTSVNISTSATDKQAGVGNAKLFSIISDRKIDVSLTTIDYRLEYFAVNIGKKINVGRHIIQSGQESITAVGGVITLGHAPIGNKISMQTATGYIDVAIEEGNREVDLSLFGIVDDCVTVIYLYEYDTRRLDFAVDTSPMIVKLVLQTPMYNNKVGRIGEVQYTFPAFQFSGNINSSLTSSDSGTIEMTGSPNAVDGDTCGSGTSYGYMDEVYYDASKLYTFSAIDLNPNEVELSVADGDTQLLEVFGSQGALVEAVLLDNDSVTFSSDDPLIATVNTAGLIEAVAEGTTTITADYDGLIATTEVTVIA